MSIRPPDYHTLQDGRPVGGTMGTGTPAAAVVHVQGPRPGQVEMGHEWESACCYFCGVCDGMGWGICCLSCWCFPCTFGFLKYRAFGSFKKAIAWALLFTFMCCVVFVYLHIFFEPARENDESSDSDQQDPFFADKGTDSDEEWFFPGLQSAMVRDKYKDDEGTVVAVSWGIAIVAFLTITIAGVWNRMRLRKRFRINGPASCCEGAPELEDACLWTFCWPCALCQEVRTVVENRVEQGMWQRPIGTVVAANEATGIPASGMVMVPLSHPTAPAAQNLATRMQRF